jgi:hypothetical protein
MKTAFSRTRRIIAGVVLVATLASCSGGSSNSSDVVATPADSGLLPTDNGFTFANFGSSATAEVFNTEDLVTMFGKEACVGGVEAPCSPTTQAAAWARMVNEARASGHCEGLAVQAAARFDSKQTPATGELLNAGDVTHGIMRAFATQFLPEVQDATNSWAKKSLSDIVNELVSSMKTGSVAYSLGIYTPTGGHAVLPYAVEFPSKDLAVIKVYDSNWPGKERYVVIDLAEKKWFFSFNGQDPQKDECAWTGKAGDLDLTPMSVRTSATCPFCGTKSTVAKSVLLIRSTGVEWEVKTKNGTFSPSEGTAVNGTTSRGLRSASCSKTVSLPEFILSVDAPDFELTLPETASAYISNGKSVVQIQTKGKKARKPIKFTETSVTSSDPGTTVTLAANNFATQVTADTTVINFDETKIVVDATVNGETSTVTANEAAPQVIVTTDTGAVVTTTNNVNLSKVEAVVTEELVPTAVKPGLAPLAEREAAAPEVTTTTAAATTTTVAAVASTVVASDPKPTTTPTAAALSAVPTAPANSPLRNDVSFTVGDPINITIPNVRPGVWLQLILSSPTRVLQTVQANSAGKVVFKTTIPLDTKVSTSALRPTSVANNLFYDLIIYSNVYKEYNQQTKIEIGPVLKTDSSPSATTTTTTVATTTTTVATTTTTVAATTTTTVAPTTTTTVPTYALTVSGAGMGSVTGNITMNPSSGTTKTCSSLSTSCVHSFPAGVTVAISFTIPETSAFVFWTPSGFGGTVGSPPCPAQGDTGGEIRPSNPGYLSSSVGTLTCSYTMTAANKALGYYVSG